MLDVRDGGPDLFAVLAKPRAEGIVVREVFEGRLRHTPRIDPVEAGMIEDDIEDDADTLLMRGVHQLDEIAARAEPRIDIQEMLDAVAVKSVQMPALLEYRAEPDRRDAQVVEVVEFGLHSLDRAALPAKRSGLRPAVPAPALPASDVGTRGGAVVTVELWPGILLAITEPIDQQEIQYLVAPVCGRGM